MTVTNEVIIMKTNNSVAIMGIIHLSVKNKFMSKSCFQKVMNFQIAKLFTKRQYTFQQIQVNQSKLEKAGRF